MHAKHRFILDRYLAGIRATQPQPTRDQCRQLLAQLAATLNSPKVTDPELVTYFAQNGL